MSRLERCGQPWSHPAHQWAEGPVGDREVHVCDGGSDDEDAYEAAQVQDSLFEAGFYA
jgi:hypothetical protein